MTPFINGIGLCCHNYFKCQIFESKGPINEYGELMPIELLWGWMYERQWKDNYPRPQISTRLLACFVSSLTFTGCCFLFPHSCSFFRFLYHAYCSVYGVTQRLKFMGHATYIKIIDDNHVYCLVQGIMSPFIHGITLCCFNYFIYPILRAKAQ